MPAAGAAQKFVVLGGAGNVGSAAVKALSAAHGDTASIIVGTRTVDSDAAKSLAALAGVTTSTADMATITAADAVFEGAPHVMVNTAGHPDRVAITLNAIKAAKEADVASLLVISVTSADVHGTVFGDQFVEIEKAVRESGLKYTLLRLPLFFENNWGNKDSIVGMGNVFAPISADSKFASVAVQDAGEVAAKLLGDDAHAGRTYTMASHIYTNTDLVKAFSKAIGKDVGYTQVPFEAAQKAMTDSGYPPVIASGVVELLKMIEAGRWVMSNPADVEFTRSVLGREPTSIEAWTSGVAAAFTA